jgi:hypothetical protein
MALILLIALVVAALVHGSRTHNQSPGRRVELLLVYMVAGYCGVFQIYSGFDLLLRPDRIMQHLGLPTGNAVTYWTASIYLGGAFAATLAIWQRGTYLLAPTIVWAVYFAGANFAHLYALQLNGTELTPVIIAFVFSTHGLVSLILIGAWIGYSRNLRLGSAERPVG